MKKLNKKERMGFVIGSTLVCSAFEVGDPLVAGFQELVSLVRTPALDECVEVALETVGAAHGLTSNDVERLFAEYTRW